MAAVTPRVAPDSELGPAVQCGGYPGNGGGDSGADYGGYPWYTSGCPNMAKFIEIHQKCLEN